MFTKETAQQIEDAGILARLGVAYDVDFSDGVTSFSWCNAETGDGYSCEIQDGTNVELLGCVAYIVCDNTDEENMPAVYSQFYATREAFIAAVLKECADFGLDVSVQA